MSPKNPSYYRSGFEGWISRFYDLSIKVVTFGFEDKVRNKIFLLTPENPQKIIDLACGTGSLTVRLKKHFPSAEVFGVDLAGKMLAQAKKKSKNLEIAYSQQNIEKTEFKENYFDLAAISFGLHEIEEKARGNVLKEIYRILKPGGILIIFDYQKVNQGFCFKIAYELFLKIFEPYAQSFIDKTGEEFLRPFRFKNIEEKTIHKIARFITGEK